MVQLQLLGRWIAALGCSAVVAQVEEIADRAIGPEAALLFFQVKLHRGISMMIKIQNR
jgi:hypothetical protein